MMRLAGTPSSRTSSTSPTDAQSKPAPRAASVEITPRSGMHFTAKQSLADVVRHVIICGFMDSARV
jgi:hypothetical protein